MITSDYTQSTIIFRFNNWVGEAMGVAQGSNSSRRPLEKLQLGIEPGTL